MCTLLCEFQRVHWNATHSLRRLTLFLTPHSQPHTKGRYYLKFYIFNSSLHYHQRPERQGDKRIGCPKQPWSICHSIVIWAKVSNAMSHQIRSLHFLFGCVMAPLLSCQYNCYLFITINIYVCIPAEYQHLQSQDRSERGPMAFISFLAKKKWCSVQA